MAKRRGWHEGTKYRRSDGLYVGRVLFDGKRHQVTARDAKERDRLLRERIRELEEGKEPTNLPRRKTVEQIVRDYLAHQKVAHPATYPGSRSYLENHVVGDPLAKKPADPIAKKRVGALTTKEVTALYQAKLDAGYAQNTVRQLHKVIRACLNWAAAEQGVPVPSPVLKMAPPAVDPVEYTQLTPAQVARLFRSIQGHELEALWRLTWYSHCRLGELLALPWSNVKLATHQIEVRRNLVGVNDGVPRFRGGKTYQSRAALHVPPDAIDALKRHFDAQQARRAAHEAQGLRWRDLGLVFDRGDGGALRHEQAERAWYAALEAAGLPRCRVHDLRGAGLTALRDAGHDLLDVQRRARHASLNTTAKSYLRLADEADQRAALTLERLVSEA